MKLTIKEIQQETLTILKEIDSICIKLGLKYALFYGSLIGAVRHKGFIPWDDDLDIIMPRKDYDKLQNYFLENEKDLLPFKLFSYKNNLAYPFFINRICDTRFTMDAENEVECGMGTFIDIYPFDGASDGRIDFTYLRARFFSSMYYLKSRKKFVSPKGFIKKILKRLLYLISKFYSKELLQKKLEKISKKYNYDDSQYVTCLVWGFVNNRPVYYKEDIESVIRVPFEDTAVFIPKNYDKLLKLIYGDYMQLPPENERIGHHFYKIYRKEK